MVAAVSAVLCVFIWWGVHGVQAEWTYAPVHTTRLFVCLFVCLACRCRRRCHCCRLCTPLLVCL